MKTDYFLALSGILHIYFKKTGQERQIMGKRLFISYNHKQRDWVKNSLLPILKASETEYFIDFERMAGGKPITSQTDNWQDRADIQVLLLSKAYFESDYCTHEMERALGYDPGFADGKIVPLKLEECELPKIFALPDVFWLDFKPPTQEGWEKFFISCDISFTACAFKWLKARNEIVRYLERKESVNLIVNGETCWKQLLRHLKDDYSFNLKEIDFDTWGTTSRKGFVSKLLQSWECSRIVPDEPDDLVLLDEIIGDLDLNYLAFSHFDRIVDKKYWDIDFFSGLRYHIMDSRKLVLLIVSRAPFATLVPKTSYLSTIEVKTIELKGKHEI
ncbi:MAG: toll/interleukin-1 receptor domain-containing protein [Spirochaetales bacterium]|nr:toll/interleukin-1 receptor domain-containing protein [Spirochaetales bacterium]